MSTGDRVQPSPSATRSLWDAYLSAGDYHRKMRLREAYDRECAKRGTITALLPRSGVIVKWDDGTTSQCLAYRVTESKP